MKSIEHKILIPFLLIVLIPNLAVGITAMWSSYQADKQQQLSTIKETVHKAVNYLEMLVEEREEGNITPAQAEFFIERYIQEHQDFYVRTDTGQLLLGGKPASIPEHWVDEKNLFEEQGVYQRDVEGLEWTVYYPYHFSVFSKWMVDIQKYTLLILIISSLIAVEFTVLLSHHVAKPLKKLARFCNQVQTTKQPDFQLVQMSRGDEVGILSTSLEKMVKSLQEKHQQLIHLQRRNESIIENTHLGMCVINDDGTIEISNRSMSDLLAQFPGLKQRLSSQLPLQEKQWMIAGEQGDYFFAVHSRVLPVDNEKHQRLITIENITERKRIEQRIERIERLNALGKMAAGLAHEIRNPLAGIKTTIQVLLRRLSLTGENKELTVHLMDEIERVERIMKQLLNLSRPSQPMARAIYVNDVINSTVQLMKPMVRKSNIQLSISLEQEKLIMADLDHMRQILLNLIMNAVEAMPNGGALTLQTFEQGDKIIIDIKDTGKGIEKELLEKIFDPFFTTRAEGTGLGLAIVHQLILQNNGEIDVQSIPNHGTRFRLSFPRKDDMR